MRLLCLAYLRLTPPTNDLESRFSTATQPIILFGTYTTRLWKSSALIVAGNDPEGFCFAASCSGRVREIDKRRNDCIRSKETCASDALCPPPQLSSMKEAYLCVLVVRVFPSPRKHPRRDHHLSLPGRVHYNNAVSQLL